jgi:transcriptional regulator with XRE-family HTH domain
MKMIKHPFSGRDEAIGFDYRRAVGNKVRDLRLAAGLTQKALGKLVGVGSNAISGIEVGRNPVPPERYRAFAVALGVDAKPFGEFLLEYSDPWLFGMIYGQEAVAHHRLDQIPDRMRKPASEART